MVTALPDPFLTPPSFLPVRSRRAEQRKPRCSKQRLELLNSTFFFFASLAMLLLVICVLRLATWRHVRSNYSSRCFLFSFFLHASARWTTVGIERRVEEWDLSARHLAFLTLFLFHSAAKCSSKLASRQSKGSLNPGPNLCYKPWIVWLLHHNLHLSLTLLTSARFKFSVGNPKCCQLNTSLQLIYSEPDFFFPLDMR